MVHITVLLVPPIQLLDLAPIDLFAMLRRSYLSDCDLPRPLLDVGLADEDVRISYVVAPPSPPSPTTPSPSTNIPTDADTVVNLPTCFTTASLTLSSTHALTAPAVAPGAVDIIFIPGPPPGTRPSAATCAWVRAHVDTGKVDLLTVCSGVYVAGFAGVLEGRSATGTRGVMGDLEERFPGTRWFGERRWVVDEGGKDGGKVWSSGGITNGMDMVAVYIRKRWPGVLSETVLAMAEVEVREQVYGQSRMGMMAYFGWLTVQAWVKGLFASRKRE